MPIFFLIVGVLLIVVSINNKLPTMTHLVKEDFNPTDGSAGFGIWLVAIFVVGALGYAKPFRPVANAFLLLLVIVMVLSNGNPSRGGGFFAKFNQAVRGI